MNRAFLSSAIEGLVSSYGYDFYHSEESHYPTILCRYPAAHLSPPEFVRMEGQKRGRVTYRVRLRLAQQAAKLPPKRRADLLAEIEQQMIDIFVALSRTEQVAVVDNLTITTTSPAIDNHGALAMVGEAEVVTIFYTTNKL